MMVDDCSPYEKQTNIEIDIFFKNLSMASVIGENKNPRDLKVYTKIALYEMLDRVVNVSIEAWNVLDIIRIRLRVNLLKLKYLHL